MHHLEKSIFEIQKKVPDKEIPGQASQGMWSSENQPE